MNTANLANCKKLYELSGWRNGDWVWQNLYADKEYRANDYLKPIVAKRFTPAYDSGFLLRQLPHYDISFNGVICTAWYETDDFKRISADSDNPEDALALLAIKLFEQNILTRKDV